MCMQPSVILERVDNPYDTILDAVIGLQDRGFTADFSLVNDRLFCSQSKQFFEPKQFDIVEIYRFDGDYYYSEETLIYAIECYSLTKGIFFQPLHRSAGNPHLALVQKFKRLWNC